MLDYTELWDHLVADIAAKVPAFAHLDPQRIAVAAAPRWAGSTWGNLACCISLRQKREPLFSVWVRRRTRTIIQVSPWFIPQPPEIVFNGVKRRYLILLRLPRALEHNPLETLIHELYHIDEKFDGSLRPVRHGREYDWRVRTLMREWLRHADPALSELAQLKANRVRESAGSILARSLPFNFRPMLIEPMTPAPKKSAYAEGVERLYPNYRLAQDFEVRPVKMTAPSTPRRILETDCPIRAFHDTGAETLAPVYAKLLAAGPRGDRAIPTRTGV